MNWAAPSAAWLFGLLVPLAALYFLKLRRPRQTVSSLVLWRQVIADQRVNAPFQRFRRNVILLLQILLLCLLVLAAMQPVWRRGGAETERQLILLDVSASMAALGKESGRARLDEAKEKARELVRALPKEQEAAVIAFARSARRVSNFSNNAAELRAALDSISVEDTAADLEEALRLAQAMHRTSPFSRVVVISDGNFAERARFELPFKLDYLRTAPGGVNYGLTACRAVLSGGAWDVFFEFASSDGAPAAVGSLELLNGGQVFGQQPVTFAPGQPTRLNLRLPTTEAALLEARLVMPGFDALDADNRIWLPLPTARPLKVFVSSGMTAMRRAFENLPELEVFGPDSTAMPSAFDLVLADKTEDALRPARTLCTAALVPGALVEKISISDEKPAQIVDWQRTFAALRHVNLLDVVFGDSGRWLAGQSEETVARLGYETVAHAVDGPLIVARQNAAQREIALLFHPDRTTLPYRVGLPVLASNLADLARLDAGLGESSPPRTGVLPEVKASAGLPVRVTSPTGSSEALADAAGRVLGVPAPRVGLYQLEAAGQPLASLGASLLSHQETSLHAAERIEFDDQLGVAASAAVLKSDRELWWPLAAAAFAFLLLEWWWFHRRSAAHS